MKYLAALLLFVFSSPVYADCVNPYDCVCTNYRDYAGVYVGLVTAANAEARSVTVQVESVHLRDGRMRTGGPEVNELIELPRVLDVGSKVMLEFEESGEPDVVDPVIVDSEDQVACPYSLNDFKMSMADALQAKLGNNCINALTEAGLEPPSCNDHAFGCSATKAGQADWGVLFLIFLLGAGLQRRSLYRE